MKEIRICYLDYFGVTLIIENMRRLQPPSSDHNTRNRFGHARFRSWADLREYNVFNIESEQRDNIEFPSSQCVTVI